MDEGQLIQIYKSQGWNDENAIRADIAAGGWRGKVQGYNGGGSTVDSILGNSINSILGGISKQQIYENVHPFSFDEALARKSATAEYEPYYNRTLEDYVQSVERKKSRSSEDLKSTLNFLSGSKDYFTGANRRILDQTLRQTKEGYAGRGLYQSGATRKDLEEVQQENASKVAEYERGYKEDVRQAELGTKRSLEDLAYEQAQKTRDISEEKKFAIESGVLQRKGEYADEYNIGRQKYYAGIGYTV